MFKIVISEKGWKRCVNLYIFANCLIGNLKFFKCSGFGPRLKHDGERFEELRCPTATLKIGKPACLFSISGIFLSKLFLELQKLDIVVRK